jgi:hypothetical protein
MWKLWCLWSERARLFGHLHTDKQQHYFASNVDRGRLSFLNERVRKNEMARGLIRTGSPFRKPVIYFKTDGFDRSSFDSYCLHQSPVNQNMLALPFRYMICALQVPLSFGTYITRWSVCSKTNLDDGWEQSTIDLTSVQRHPHRQMLCAHRLLLITDYLVYYLFTLIEKSQITTHAVDSCCNPC